MGLFDIITSLQKPGETIEDVLSDQNKLDEVDRLIKVVRESPLARHIVLMDGVTYGDVLLIPKMSLPSKDATDTRGVLVQDTHLDIPIISANMDTVTGIEMAVKMAQLGGLGVLYRVITYKADEERVRKAVQHEAVMIREVKRRAPGHPVAASLGINGDYKYIDMLIEAGLDIAVFDIANAYSDQMKTTIGEFKRRYPDIPIIAGNVANAEATSYLIDAGADCVKVGIGPGSACTTRIVTGHGYPQLSAVYECAREAKKHGIPIIADGGIREPGDVVKALAAGAATVMIGGVISATLETPGDVYVRGDDKVARRFEEPEILSSSDIKTGIYFKIYRGMASQDVQEEAGKPISKIVPEGEALIKKYKGPVEPIIQRFVGGLRSGMSYSHARTIQELQQTAVFYKVSGIGLQENDAHGAEQFRHKR